MRRRATPAFLALWIGCTVLAAAYPSDAVWIGGLYDDADADGLLGVISAGGLPATPPLLPDLRAPEVLAATFDGGTALAAPAGPSSERGPPARSPRRGGSRGARP
jgi:hypothetical protein